jgi:hypothetical protein
MTFLTVVDHAGNLAVVNTAYLRGIETDFMGSVESIKIHLRDGGSIVCNKTETMKAIISALDRDDDVYLTERAQLIFNNTEA